MCLIDIKYFSITFYLNFSFLMSTQEGVYRLKPFTTPGLLSNGRFSLNLDETFWANIDFCSSANDVLCANFFYRDLLDCTSLPFPTAFILTKFTSLWFTLLLSNTASSAFLNNACCYDAISYHLTARFVYFAPFQFESECHAHLSITLAVLCTRHAPKIRKVSITWFYIGPPSSLILYCLHILLISHITHLSTNFQPRR